MPRSSWKAWPALTLPLAADARMVDIDYKNDQIWELAFGEGESSTPRLRTNYGLRARNMSIFPRFRFPGRASVPSTTEAGMPLIEELYPNFLRLELHIHAGIHTVMEYWVPGGQVITGRVSFQNTGRKPLQMQWQLAAELLPFDNGARLEGDKIGGAEILHGRTSDLYPVLFLTGGPEAVESPYAALALDVDLAPGQRRRFTWVHAALGSTDESFRLARQTAAMDWQPETARIEMRKKSQPQIVTGDEDWDRTLDLSAQFAFSLLHSPTPHLPHITFVEARRPEHGYYPPASGADYHQIWLGQSVINAWYLLDFLLPGETSLAEGLLLNFLSAQSHDGRVDSKPGLSGYRSYTMAMPFLADVAWRIFEVNEERGFLEKVYPPLAAFHQAWFDEAQDRDNDGLPEWSHAVQAGFEDHPIFAHWHAWSQGADIGRFRSPLLLSLLYLQAKRLLEISSRIENNQEQEQYLAQMESLRAALDETWEARLAVYRNMDAQSNEMQRGMRLGSGTGAGTITIARTFRKPARLIVRLEGVGEDKRKLRISLSGKDPQGKRQVERMDASEFRWGRDFGTATAKNLFSHLESVKVEGAAKTTRMMLSGVDTTVHDITLFAPLYAGVPDEDRGQKMIQRKIQHPMQYWGRYGMPAFLARNKKAGEASRKVWLPWMAMAVRGLLAYDRRQLAAQLVGNVMNGTSRAVRANGEFRQFLHADSGESLGERNHLAGLPPPGLFMDVLGVKVISPWKVGLEGVNPFPRPVTVNYRGLRIERGLSETVLTFPDGRSITVDDAAACVVDGRAVEGDSNKKEPSSN